MLGNMSRTSMLMFMRRMLMAAPGLALRRRYLAHHWQNWGSLATEGARSSTEYGPPHSFRRASVDASNASGLIPQGQSGACCRLAYALYRMSERARSGYVAANKILMAPPSDPPKSA